MHKDNADVWYAEIKGKADGPFDEFEIGEHFYDDLINGDTLVWQDGMSDWQPLRQTKLRKLIVEDDTYQDAEEAQEAGFLPALPRHLSGPTIMPEQPQAATHQPQPKNRARPPKGNPLAGLSLISIPVFLILQGVPILQFFIGVGGLICAIAAYKRAGAIEREHYSGGFTGPPAAARLLTTLTLGFYMMIIGLLLLWMIGLAGR